MLYRKVSGAIESYLKSDSNKMLVVDGARQVGKSYIIRHIGKQLFSNYIEVNMENDKHGRRLFENARTVEDFMIALSSIAGGRMKQKKNTLVFIDEIQAYDHLLTLVKFLMEDGRFTYIASGSQLGIALKKTQSVPLGSLEILHMYPLDFEEFLVANGVGPLAIDDLRQHFVRRESLDENRHLFFLDLFRKYLLVGGMPDPVNIFLHQHNLVAVRKAQCDIMTLYKDDAAKYEMDAGRKLKIQRIYGMVPSVLENKKKRIVARDIEDKVGARMGSYQDEFDYLIASGITLDVSAISQPSYPLKENSGKNLLKLYMNDVGLLTALIYRNNIQPVLKDDCSVNLGSVYENVVAQELHAHDFELYYYDNKKHGEVDYLVDDADNLTTMPIEVKSGKDYYIHSALDHFIETPNYGIKRSLVLNNGREVYTRGKTTYIPVYFIMFLLPSQSCLADVVEI